MAYEIKIPKTVKPEHEDSYRKSVIELMKKKFGGCETSDGKYLNDGCEGDPQYTKELYRDLEIRATK